MDYKNNRNIFLDYLRAIACLLVILYHYTQRFSELFSQGEDWAFRIPWGFMAIATFFTLSGYLAVIKDDESLSLWQYIKKKCLRLFPAYWVCLPITFLITTLFIPSRAVSFRDFFINFTMLESFLGVGLVDGAYWTLANELVFYAFIAFTVVVLKKRKKLPLFGFIWILLLIIHHVSSNDNLVFTVIGKIIAKQYGHMFVLGMSLFFLVNKQDTMMRVISVANVIMAIVYHYIVFGWWYSCYLVFSGLLIGISIVLNRRGVWISDSVKKCLYPLEILAGISYPLYLIHQNIGYAIILAEINWGLKTEWLIITPIIIMCIVAYWIHRIIEVPIVKKL